jgi:hypothetical protein
MVFFVVAFRCGHRRKKAEMASGIEMIMLSRSQGKVGREVCRGGVGSVLGDVIGFRGDENGG